MNKSSLGFVLLVFFLAPMAMIMAQDATVDSTENNKEEKIKKGFGFGVLPVIGYNTDIGLQYGIIFNLFNYGDGSYYPGYKYSIYTEISRTTKGSGVNQLFFDSKHLLPGNIRVTADLSYLTELALNFYGFNGYEAVYNPGFEEEASDSYISRMYYRHERKFIRTTLDFQGKLGIDKLLWFAGIGYFDLKVGSVDIERLNKGKKEEDILPDTALLYDNYVDWGIIGTDEKDGGNVPSIKVGLIYDSRDHEVNPMKGIWSEALVFYSPALFGNNYSYLKLSITHRQYFTLIKDDLSFAYRLAYQGTISGEVPFFMQPYMINSFSLTTTTDGLGGAQTLRGILRNRVVGDGVGFGNFELRWKFLRTVIWNQNIYLALIAFSDVGKVIKPIEVNLNPASGPDLPENYFDLGAEDWHWSAGAGIRVVLNRNFAVAFDYGKAFDKRDGKDGFYAGIGFLF